MRENMKILEIIQFTDIHLDLDYTIGAKVDCADVLCCRKDSGMAVEGERAAGPFGAVGFCDIPVSVLEKMSKKINELQPDTLFWTGDVAPHDMWNYSQDYVETYQKYLYDHMKTHVGQYKTFLIEGNHDFGEVINS